MAAIPEILVPHLKGSRLVITSADVGTDLAALSEYLRCEQNLTCISMPDFVSIPPRADGGRGAPELAAAILQGHSPNLLEVAVAGGYTAKLAELCESNRRHAVALIHKARDSNSVLKKDDCIDIARCLPAMLAIAEAHGAQSNEHSMSNRELADMFERIQSHAAQHNVDVGVGPHIARLRPATMVATAEASVTTIAAAGRVAGAATAK